MKGEHADSPLQLNHMTRLFLPPDQLSSEQITITGDQARYLALVLRIKPGDPLIIFDGLGYKYDCNVLKCHKKEVIVESTVKSPYSTESPVSITLAQGITKGIKMDLVIQKATELGVSKIVPIINERSQVRHTEKLERWRKIALSASQQSGRDKIPEIYEPVDFEEFLFNQTQEKRQLSLPIKREGEDFFNHGIIFSEQKPSGNLKTVLNSFRDIKDISILIGPEGGFTKEEVHIAIQKGFIETSLGPRILRTETAPITAVSIIQYELGDVS